MKPTKAIKNPTEVHTWYGARGRVELHDPLWHIAGIWGLDLPHPPLVNLLIRKGLPREAKLELSFHHEFGHLQMLPFSLLGTVVLLHRSWRAGRLSWNRLPWLWAKHHAFWEMLAESYVMGAIGPRYKALYGNRLHRGLLIFWLGTAILVALTRPIKD